jgi:hypothetical protein
MEDTPVKSVLQQVHRIILAKESENFVNSLEGVHLDAVAIPLRHCQQNGCPGDEKVTQP